MFADGDAGCKGGFRQRAGEEGAKGCNKEQGRPVPLCQEWFWKSRARLAGFCYQRERQDFTLHVQFPRPHSGVAAGH